MRNRNQRPIYVYDDNPGMDSVPMTSEVYARQNAIVMVGAAIIFLLLLFLGVRFSVRFMKLLT